MPSNHIVCVLGYTQQIIYTPSWLAGLMSTHYGLVLKVVVIENLIVDMHYRYKIRVSVRWPKLKL